jgi:hypothetical protein
MDTGETPGKSEDRTSVFQMVEEAGGSLVI